MFNKTAIRRYTAEQIRANTKGDPGSNLMNLVPFFTFWGGIFALGVLNKTYPSTRHATNCHWYGSSN
jgi:hypothetical protein